MKKKIALFTLFGFLAMASISLLAQDSAEAADSTVPQEIVEETAIEEAAPIVEMEEKRSFHQIIKQKFIEGGPTFMGIVLLCLILGLALAIERIIYLNLATSDSAKLLNDVERALQSGGVEAAKDVCRNTKGPVASIFYQGLDRSGEGIDMEVMALSADKAMDELSEYHSYEDGKVDRPIMTPDVVLEKDDE